MQSKLYITRHLHNDAGRGNWWDIVHTETGWVVMTCRTLREARAHATEREKLLDWCEENIPY